MAADHQPRLQQSADFLVVVRQLAQPAGELLPASVLELGGRRVHQQLQGGQPLLPVDHRPLLHPTGGLAQRLQHDCAEEVSSGRTARQPELGCPADVLPQGAHCSSASQT